MKETITKVLTLMMAATMFASNAQAAVSMKVATTGNEKHQSTIAAQAFKDKVEELSGGVLKRQGGKA